MKTLLITIFIVLICIDFNVLEAQPLTQTQITAIEKAITEEMKVAGIPGVALAIINDNQVVYEKSFGLANSQTKMVMTDSSIFQIASVTKIFTALTMLTELRDANIGVYEPVDKVIKGLSPGLSSITFHQLLTHTGGLIEYTNESDKTGVYDFFKNIGDTILFTEPGKVFSYSNMGFALLDLAIEKLSGMTYSEAVNKAVLKPLKLKNTRFDLFEVASKSFSAGHISRNGILQPALGHFEVPLLRAAGGLFSNLQDMERLALCLMNNGVLDGVQVFDPGIIEQMFLPHAKNFMASVPSYFGFLNYPNNAYGYGTFMFDYGKLHFIGNAGAGTNTTYMLCEPETKFSMIIMSNKAWDVLFDSFKKIFEVVPGEKEPIPVDFEMNRKEWKEITGKYFLPTINKNDVSSAVVSEKEDKLYINFNNQGDVEFEQIGQLVYRYSTPFFRFPVEIGFHRDESNKVAYLRNIWRTWVKIE
jgi:CubicO group peptidase (beta-lactamase class C family)